MKKIYICPETEVIEAEAEGVVCASIKRYGVVDGENDGENYDENPNGPGGLPSEVVEVGGNDGPPSTAKEFDLWGDFDW